MKVHVKKIDAIKRELKFDIPKDRVSQKLDKVYEELTKVAKIKGFRPGKVPRQILETQHSHVAKEEVLKQIIPEAYQEALEKEKLFPIDMPEISDVSYKDGAISFKAILEIKPEIIIKDYKRIKVVRKSSEVTEEEINKTLDYFKKGQGPQKENEIQLDDAFARGLGYPNLDEFKKFLRRQMEADKDRQNKIDVENQIIEALLKKAKLVVPSSLAKRQLENRIDELKKRLKNQGLDEQKIKEREENLRKDLQETVEKDIKVYLILEKIAEIEKMEINQGENLPMKVIEFLLKEAQWDNQQNPQ